MEVIQFLISDHFVWVTKYRYRVLQGDIALRLRELIRQTCDAFGIRIISGVVSKDHVHISVSAPPSMAPGGIMRRIRGRSSAELSGEFPHVKKRYRGRRFRGRGYFCAASGQVTDDMIRSYLEHHSEPNPDDKMKAES